ncbi:MAG: hypothetical protein RLZZ136_370 [Pseudomonadota bacterium]|jgi:hypothetical protein
MAEAAPSTVASESHQTPRALGWRSDGWTWAAIALSLLAALPPILARYPQMTDYPAHLARWYVMLVHGENPVIDQYYGFRWAWSGNLGADLLIHPLAALFGLETGGRIIVILIPLLTGLALITVERTLRGRVGVGTLLALATIWSPSLIMGFLNFTLSLALALFAFAFWVRSAGWKWRNACFVPIGLLVWLCHQSGWGVLGVMVFGYEWQRDKNLLRAVKATLPLWLPILPTVLASQQAAGSLNYGRNPLWVKWIEWKTAMRDREGYLDLASTAFFCIIPFVAMAYRKFDWRLGWAVAIMVVLTLVVPRHLGGGDYADYRLIGVALMLGALAIDWRAPNWLMPLAAVPFLVRIMITALAWQATSTEVSAMLRALNMVPRGAKVAYAFEEVRTLWPTPAYGHIGSWATVRRDALVNCHFAIPGVHMLQIKQPDWHFVDPSQRYLLRMNKRVDLSTFAPAKVADFIWYYGERPPIRLPDGAEVIFSTKHSFIARLHHPVQQGAVQQLANPVVSR